MHATDLLDAPPAAPAPFAVAFGPSSFLKRAVREALVGSLTAEDPDAAPSVYAGDDVDAARVLDEVSTVSMFGGGRVVVVESADKFVTNHRPTLEAYAAKAKPGSLLLLEVEKFPKTTKLYKALAKTGLLVECADLAGEKLNAWLRKQATSRFEKTLPAPAAAAMIELVGEDLTLLSQELAKLDSYAGDRAELTVEDVAAVVGGWRTQTTFELLAAVRQGDLDRAIAQLGKLLDTGESPHRILGGVTFTVRRLAKAVDLTANRPLGAALKSAGVFPKEQAESERYLRRIGRARAEKLRHTLLDADLALKGQGGKLDERVVVERLLVELGQSAGAS